MTKKDKKDNIIELTDIVDQNSNNESKQENNKSFDLNDRIFKVIDALAKEQIKFAIEKVVKEKFSKEIEPLFFQIVEKVVKKEIAKVKKTILEKV